MIGSDKKSIGADLKARLSLFVIVAIIMNPGGASSQTGEAIGKVSDTAGAIYENLVNPTSPQKAATDIVKGVAADAAETAIVLAAKEAIVHNIIMKGAEAFVDARAVGDLIVAEASKAAALKEAASVGAGFSAAELIVIFGLAVAANLAFPEYEDDPPISSQLTSSTSGASPSGSDIGPSSGSSPLSNPSGTSSAYPYWPPSGSSSGLSSSSSTISANGVTLTLYVHDGGVITGKPLGGVAVIAIDAAGNGFSGITKADGSISIPGTAGKNWQFIISDGSKTQKWSSDITETGRKEAYFSETTPTTTTPTTQSQSTTPTTPSQPTPAEALTPEQMDALIEQMRALEKTIQDYHDSGTGSSITPTPTTTTPTTTTPTTTSPSTPATSIYASEIPVGGTQTKYFSTANVPTGQVALSLDIKDENGNTVPVGTKVTIKDGSGNYVQADWDSTGYTVAHGAPGNWVITVNAPGYNTNTQYVLVSSSVSGTSFKTNLQRAGVNDLPAPTGLPTVTQSAAETPVPDSISSTSNKGQFTAKFVIPPGGQITGTDGAGNPVQATADSNGYVAISGSPGSWKITASATGYETLTINDYKFSGTEVYGGSGYVNLGLQKATIENQAPEQAIAYFSVQKGGVVGPVLVPGATITVQDGSGNIIEQQVDGNGHATIAGTAGLWQYAITAPGYATQKGYLSVSGGSTTSDSAKLQPVESGRSSAEPVSFDPVPAQVTEKFQAAPGTLITGTDGVGNEIQATADENGYAVITAAPGGWQWTVSAPGYLTSGPFSYLFTADSSMSLPQTKAPETSAPVETPAPAGTQAPVSSVPGSGSVDTGIGDTESVDTAAPELDLGDHQLSVTHPVDTDLNAVQGNPDPEPDTKPTEASFGDTHLSVTHPVDTDLNAVQGNPEPDTKSTETSFADTPLSVTQPVDTDLNAVQGNPDPEPDTKPTETSFGDTPLSVTQPVDTDLNSLQGNPEDNGNLVLTGNADDTDYRDTGTTGHTENTKATNTNIFGQPVSIESTTSQIIPIGDTGTKHTSTTEYPSGSAMLSIGIRNENDNLVPAGTVITVRDGAGQEVQADWDSTGHALVSGAPGYWTITVNAPGYETNTQYATVSISPSPTNLRMNLNKDGINLQPQASPFPASLPQINNPQPPENIQSGGLSQTEKDDILIDRLESLQGKGLSGDEVMSQLDEMQNQLDEQSS